MGTGVTETEIASRARHALDCAERLHSHLLVLVAAALLALLVK